MSYFPSSAEELGKVEKMPKKSFMSLTRSGQYKRIRKLVSGNDGIHASKLNSRDNIVANENIATHIHHISGHTSSNLSDSNQSSSTAATPAPHQTTMSQDLRALSGQIARFTDGTDALQMALHEVCRRLDEFSKEMRHLREAQRGSRNHECLCETWYTAQDHRALSGQIARLQMALHEVCRQLDEFSKEMRHLREALRGSRNHEEYDRISFDNLPLSNSEDFEILQRQLTSNEGKKAFIKLLRTVGGADLPQCINNILRRVMIDDLAMKFSYTGKTTKGNAKLAFGRTEVSKCILNAVQCLYGEKASETKYGTLASKWFQQAKTRVDRRAKGQNQASQPERKAEPEMQNGELDNGES